MFRTDSLSQAICYWLVWFMGMVWCWGLNIKCTYICWSQPHFRVLFLSHSFYRFNCFTLLMSGNLIADVISFSYWKWPFIEKIHLILTLVESSHIGNNATLYLYRASRQLRKTWISTAFLKLYAIHSKYL